MWGLAQGSFLVSDDASRFEDRLAGFERIWLIYWLHKAPKSSLLVTPFLDTRERGSFATRAPARPSPIGISAVRLLAIQEGVLEVADVDIIDGTRSERRDPRATPAESVSRSE